MINHTVSNSDVLSAVKNSKSFQDFLKSKLSDSELAGEVLILIHKLYPTRLVTVALLGTILYGADRSRVSPHHVRHIKEYILSKGMMLTSAKSGKEVNLVLCTTGEDMYSLCLATEHCAEVKQAQKKQRRYAVALAAPTKENPTEEDLRIRAELASAAASHGVVCELLLTNEVVKQLKAKNT